MIRNLRSWAASLIALSVAASGLLLAPAEPATASVSTPQVVTAVDNTVSDTAWDAGHIMSDALMFDGPAMSLTQIQAFLSSKGKACTSSATIMCLKDARFTTNGKTAIAPKCTADLPKKTNQTAAQVIYSVSRACNVSPKVLLVTLQKEQGLVTATNATAADFAIATGYACPDGEPCQSKFFGFFNQVYWAARAYQAYRFETWQYNPGVVSNIYLNTLESCGKKVVTVENLATKALYNYTPYTPNQASIANPYGKGDKCSSYGNRNFWLFYNAWFGNSRAGDFLVTSGSSVNVTADGSRWALPAGSSRLLASLKKIDVVAKVSSTYIKSFSLAGFASPIVRDDNGGVFLVANSKRYQLDDCAAATSFGLSCSNAIELPADALTALPVSTELVGRSSVWVASSTGAHFVVLNGEKREIADVASIDPSELGVKIALDAVFVEPIPRGEPILEQGELVAVRGTGGYVIKGATQSFLVSASLAQQVPLASWFAPSNAAIDPESLALLEGPVAFPAFFSSGGNDFVLTAAGKRPTSTLSQWVPDAMALDSSIANQLPLLTALDAPRFVRSKAGATIYLVSDAERRKVASSDVAAVASSLGIAGSVSTVPSYTIASIPLGAPVIPAATIIKISGSSATWMIDGTSSRIAVSAAQISELTAATTPRVLTVADAAGYAAASGSVLPGLSCDGQKYLAVTGVLRTVSDADAAEYGAAYGFRSLDDATCARLVKKGAIGHFLKQGTTYYAVESGERRVLTAAEYAAESQGELPAVSVSTYFARLIPVA